MKTSILLSYVLMFMFLNCTPIHAQKFLWGKTIGSNDAEFGFAIATDDLSNVYAGGCFSDTINVSLLSGTGTLISKGSVDAFIIKSDSSGNLLWSYGVGSTGLEQVSAIATDDSGNVYATGFFSNTVDFDNSISTATLTALGAIDVFVLKMNSGGNFVWVKQIGGTQSEHGNAITIDLNGDIFVAGDFTNTVDFDPGTGSNLLNSSGSSDAFLLKLDPSGNFILAKKWGSTSIDEVFGITISADNNILAVGRCTGTLDLDPGPGTYTVSTGGFQVSFVEYLDNSGNFLWGQIVEGTANNSAYSVACDKSKNIAVSGHFSGQADFDPGFGTNLLSSGSLFNQNIYIWKLDSSGSLIWANQIGNSGLSEAFSIKTDTLNNIYFCGTFDGIIDFDPYADTSFSSSSGSPDAYLCKWDEGGNLIWSKEFTSQNSTSAAMAVEIDKNGALLLTGYFNDSIDLDGGLKNVTYPSLGNIDFFFEKMAPCSAYVHPILIGGDLTLCPNDTLVLSADPAVSYSWSNEANTPSIFVTNSGFFFVTVNDSDNCDGVSASIYVSQDSLPTAAGAILGDSSLAACINQLGIVYSIDTIAGANFYDWNIPPFASIVSGIFTNQITVNYSPYSQSGTISVSGNNACGAGSSSSLFLNFKPIPTSEICLATVDSATQKTIIEWQKPIESYVNGYVIYRETPNLSGNYAILDTVPDAVFSSFLDTSSQPAFHPESYKIAVLDSCGNVGDISASFNHQTSRLYGTILFGGIAKLYWTDYIGINDSTRYFNLLRDTTGSGPFNDTLYKNITPLALMNATDPTSANYPLCRYVAEMVYNSNCLPGLRLLASRNTSRSNIKNKTALIDSSSVGIDANQVENLGIKIYPNPAKENLIIDNLIQSLAYEIYLYNSIGKCVESTTISGNTKLELNLRDLPAGLYLIKVKSKTNQASFKIQIE